MKQEIYLNDFKRAFKDINRDYYSYDGYQALYDYYDEIEGFELDVIAICCEVTEYDEEDLLKDYSHMLDKEDYLDEEEFLITEDYIEDLLKELEQHTTIIKLDNGSYLVWEF